jgi:hypothetical protein
MAKITVEKTVPDEIYEHKTEDKKLEVYSEEHPVSPRSWDNYGVMVCSHRRYNLGDREPATDNHSGWKGVEEEIRENNDVELILPLYLYDHSGITISTTPFQSSFDSGQVGFIYVTTDRLDELGLSEEKRTEDQLRTILKGEVEVYDQYLRGEVYRYEFVDDEDGKDDSCGGFFGDDRQVMFDHVAGEDMEDYNEVKPEWK